MGKGNDEAVKSIFKTYDYDKFTIMEDNRKIYDGHVKDMEDNISRIGYVSGKPILVNEKFEIIDGQHRYIACRDLNEPIYYSIEEGATASLAPDTNV